MMPLSAGTVGVATKDQHFWIVRHGDKMDSYPNCPAEPLCFNETSFGNNPSLSQCGHEQAKLMAQTLQMTSAALGGIQNIVVSPFTRTLQTSLPLAKALGLKLKVERLLSEADRLDDPFRESNMLQPAEVLKQLEEVHQLWDLDYGSLPIPTPETVPMYGKRIQKAASFLKKRFPPSTGNLAIITHATPTFSIAYGLCHSEDGTDEMLKEFVEHQDAIAPCGAIHVVLDAAGRCKAIDQTANVASSLGCGRTDPYKCKFSDYPAWYWPNSGIAQNPTNC